MLNRYILEINDVTVKDIVSLAEFFNAQTVQKFLLQEPVVETTKKRAEDLLNKKVFKKAEF